MKNHFKDHHLLPLHKTVPEISCIFMAMFSKDLMVSYLVSNEILNMNTSPLNH